MPYTDEQIRSYAAQLDRRGATPAEIEGFIATAKAEQNSAVSMLHAVASGQTPPQQRGPDFTPQNFNGFNPSIQNVRGVPLGKIADMGMEAGGAAAGQALGAMTGVAAPAMIPTLGALGGTSGNLLGQLRRGGPISYGQLAGAAIAGAVPGGTEVKAVGQGAKFAAGNLAAKSAETFIDRKEAPTATEAMMALAGGLVGGKLQAEFDTGGAVREAAMKRVQNSARDMTIAKAQAAGYVTPPSAINPGSVNKTLEAIAGKAQTAQEALRRNQEITDTLARKDLGLPPEAPLTLTALEQVRKSAAKPYEEVSAMAKQAEADLEALKKSRFTAADAHELAIQMSEPKTVKEMSDLAIKAGADVNALKIAKFNATKQREHWMVSKDPDALEASQYWTQRAEDLQDKIIEAAQKFGRPGLADDLQAARVRIAKAYEVERALNLADSNVSAPILGRSLDKGTKLTDGLQTIANTQQSAAFRPFMRESGTIGPAGLGQFLPAGGRPGGGILASTVQSTIGVPARSIALSRWYQNGLGMALPQYGGRVPDFAAQFSRMGAQAAGRQTNDFLKFLETEFPRQQ